MPSTRADSREAILMRLRDGSIPPAAPSMMLGARFGFALAAQGLVAVLFRLRRHTDPWDEAARWWMVDGTLVDLGSLVALSWLTRREGLRLRDLLGSEPVSIGCIVRESLGALAVLAPAVALSSALQRLFYGPKSVPPQVSVARLPTWASIYSIAIWPALWGLAEELTFLGYALPRLEAQTGGTGAAAALVAVAWAGQHVAMPLLFSGRYLVARVLTALPVTSAMTLYFLLRGRRLLPLVVAHWASDAGSALTAALVARRA